MRRIDLLDISYGIDFGTTNSACVGMLSNREDIKYTDGHGNPFSSLIAIDKISGEVFGGREAWKQRQELSQSCEIIPSVKGFLGSDHKWKMPSGIWTPEKVAAQIFLGLKDRVAKQGADIKNAVVAVPATFSGEKRQSLRQAASMAGVEIKSFISEPTAALIHSYHRVGGYDKIAVFDWGGGTLDISVLHNNAGGISEVAVTGTKLGGDDVDLKLAHWAHNQIVSRKGSNKSFEEMAPQDRDLMLVRCERAKCELGDLDEVSIRLNKYGEFGSIFLTLDLETLTQVILAELEIAVNLMRKALKAARMSFEELGCILMVGGSSQLAPLGPLAEEYWAPCPLVFADEIDWSVAYGASMLSNIGGQYHSSESIGLELSDGTFFPLINRGEPLSNSTVNAAFGLTEDSSSAIFKFVNSRGDLLDYFTVPAYGFLSEKLELKSYVDNNHVLNVEISSNHMHSTDIKVWKYSGINISFILPRNIKQDAI